MNALIGFLEALSLLVKMKNGGEPNDVSKLLELGATGARAKGDFDVAFTEARDKVQQLVNEDRGLTDEESAAIDASIEAKLARAAAVDLDTDPPPAG